MMMLKALLLSSLLFLASADVPAPEGTAEASGEQFSHCPSGTCKVSDLSLLQFNRKLKRQSAGEGELQSAEEVTQEGEVACSPEDDPSCQKKVKVEIPPFEIPIPCCKGCPCGKKEEKPEEPPFTIVKTQLPGAKQGICSWSGDPHIITFDGARTGLQKSGVFWSVHSKDGPQIQMKLRGAGLTTELAIGGPWMKGHTVIVTEKGPVLLDGKSTHSETDIEGVGKIKFKGGLELTPEQLKELDHDKGAQHKYQKRAKQAKVILELPFKTVVLVKHANILLKMPQVIDLGGYCGNFNGDPNDDHTGQVTKQGYRKEKIPKGTMLDQIPGEESFFKKAASVIQEEEARMKGGREEGCSAELLAKAKKACKHIPEEKIHENCVIDVCLTKDLVASEENALDMEVMRLQSAKGAVEFTGSGKCVDQDGQEFTAVEAKSISDRQGCLAALFKLSKHKGVTTKVRGAQYDDGADKCYFLTEDLSEDDVKKFKLDGRMVSAEGSGIVAKADESQGWFCWNLVD